MARKKSISQKEYNPEEHPDDGGKLKPGRGRESFRLAGFWKEQINAVDEGQARWIKRGNMVLKRFRDERSKLETEGMRRMNLLWANIKIMKPAIYSKCPIPIIDRKFLDRDPTGRLSSQILERTTKSQLSNNFHSSMTRAVYDRLLPGRGVVWPRYEPKIGEDISIPASSINGVEDALIDIAKDSGDTQLIDETESENQLETTGSSVIAEKNSHRLY